MTTHADDQPMPGFGAPVGDYAPRAGRRSADNGGTLRPRRLPTPDWGRHPAPRDPQRYYLCSEEPSGEFVEIIIPVTDGGRRRYFTTSDGERLTEVDEDYFVHRREGDARSLLELDAREMAELQAELNFVRPVLGRDPLAEAAAEAANEKAAEPATEVAEQTDDPWMTDDSEPTEVIELPFPFPVRSAEPAAPEPAVAEPVVAAQPAADSAVVEPAAVEPATPESSAAEADPQDRDDDDDQMIEEYHPVIGSNRFEQLEPGASAMPANVTQMPISVTGPIAPLAPAAQPGHEVDAAAQVALAKGIAFAAHRGQLDQIGAEYIDHPGRVAERFDPLTEPVLVAAAWLHDVLEDTAVTAQNLLEAGVQPEVVEIVQLLTRTADVADEAYYARISRHPVARRVKLADLDDNTAPWRVRRLEYDAQVRLAEKYRHARQALSAG